MLLDISNPAISGYATHTFADQGDVLIHARIAADATGTTQMDRPEWSYTNPANGEVHITLTHNSNRRAVATGTQPTLAPPALGHGDDHQGRRRSHRHLIREER